MIVVRICVKSKAEEQANLVSLLEENILDSLKFEGCQRFQVFQDIQDKQGYILYEEWKSQDCFDAYRESAYFKEIGGKIFPLLDGKPDAAYFHAESISQ